METLEKIFLVILQTSLTASMVVILVSLILKVFNNYIGIRIRNILWLLVLIKLFIPAIPETQINLFSILYEKYESSLHVQEVKNNLQEGKELTTVSKEKNDNIIYNQDVEVVKKDNIQEINKQNLILWILKIASCIWAIGVLILIAAFLVFTFNFKRKVKHLENYDYPEVVNIMKECRHIANIRSRIPIYIYNGFKSPCILGVIKPKIYIPEHVLNTSDSNALSHIFLHELIHYKRKDLVYNFLGIIAISIHWFNPVVWFAINKMKICREFACDAGVLEVIGENEFVEYGMTLINLSKVFSNNNEYSRLAIYFETNNQIKGRIKMIKQFKRGSSKISAIGALSCVIATTVILTNSINVKALDITNTTVSAESGAINTNENNTPKFIVDTPNKAYDNIEKVEKVAGFKFKVPDFPVSSQVESLQLIKISDQDNVLLIYPGGDVDFTFQVSEKDPLEYLKKIETVKNRTSDNLKVESEEQPMKLGEIDGFSVTVSAISPAETFKNGDVKPESQDIDKFFAWKNEGLWYSIRYNSVYISSEANGNQSYSISQENIEKIAKSIVYPEEIKNVNYSVEKEVSTEIATLMIYDKEDLEKAKNLLGFNPKFPLKINEDIKINGSAVGIAGDSDIESNKINYELDSFYSHNGGPITFHQGKTSKDYEDMKKNGYINQKNWETNETEQIKVQKLDINNNEVFKYVYTMKNKYDFSTNYAEYVWKENNIYYLVYMGGNTNDSDEIATDFVNSKPID